MARRNTQPQDISTHDLARRSSVRGWLMDAIEERFQLTTSQGGRLMLFHTCCQLVLFQLTTSQGGRLCFAVGVLTLCNFNSRPRKEVVARAFPDAAHITGFQLTTSQGGRLHLIRSGKSRSYFNSRPRKEGVIRAYLHPEFL